MYRNAYKYTFLLASILTLASGLQPTCGRSPRFPEEAATAFIPFSNAAGQDFPQQPPQIRFAVTTQWDSNAHNFSTTMDTGSTGIALSASTLGLQGKTFDTSQPGTEYLSSSKVFWEGFWVPAQLTFDGGVVAAHRVLAVVNASHCTDWDPLAGLCHARQDLRQWPTDIAYVGVGFGRWSTEQPQACPDKVPFLNVLSVDGAPVAGSIHRGYVVNGTGVTIGLNRAVAKRFVATKLYPNPSSEAACAASTTQDWQMVNMSIAINDTDIRNQGQALFDTGVMQSYITVYEDIYNRIKPSLEPGTNLLPNGTLVDVLIGDPKRPIAHYQVKVNDSRSLLNPYQGQFRVSKWTSKSVHGPFINTGRFFYKGYDILFDAECGWFGLRNLQLEGKQGIEILRNNV